MQINIARFLERNRNSIAKYKAEATQYLNVFKLNNESIFVSLHFEDGIFKDIKNKSPLNLESYLQDLKAKFNVQKIVLSCCYPAQAKAEVEKLEGVELVGDDWNGEVSTVFNNKKGVLRLEKKV